MTDEKSSDGLKEQMVRIEIVPSGYCAIVPSKVVAVVPAGDNSVILLDGGHKITAAGDPSVIYDALLIGREP